MAGLVGYASSDEEEDEVQEPIPQKVQSLTLTHFRLTSAQDDVKPSQPSPPLEQEIQESLPPEDGLTIEDGITIGPIQQHSVPLGPSLPTVDAQPLQGPSAPDSGLNDQAPSSPYTASRALLRDLTLPPVPNFDIPPSPPGSPPPALSTKFTQFLDLKKKGVHFNAKLAQSTALRNPSLTDKLMGFVDLDGRAGYATTLPTDLWDPTSEASLPEWASRAALRQSQERVRAERAGLRKTGGPIDFVPASDVASPSSEAVVGGAAASSEQGGISRAGKRKAGAW
ncbi:HCNGP-like protein [Colletotrichum musicola]|uniref:HCNGP-like protein n=1 Tax=Colletotrichum musicola TaxID=2175873 RepID=A0A8H6U966_9PEZI|nr:HCNGP-like protein [Colletotrichum musicola]